MSTVFPFAFLFLLFCCCVKYHFQLTNQEAAKLTGFVKRRIAREPLAYIAGSREFWSMDFAVTPDTLIPRSDAEVLIETLVVRNPFSQ